jgi:hypothetical protein
MRMGKWEWGSWNAKLGEESWEGGNLNRENVGGERKRFKGENQKICLKDHQIGGLSSTN